MYIGLIDDDLRANRKTYPNLELMKLASFHKSNRDIVEMVRDYRTYERFTKLYLRKNLMDNDMPNLFLSKARHKCEYGGYAFSNGIYIPMDKAIEESLPDVTIYDKILNIKKDYKTLLNKGLIRLETQKNIIPVNSKRSFLVYDKNITSFPNYQELLDIALLIELVEPQHFTDLAAAIQLAGEEKLRTNSIIVYDKDISIKQAIEIKEEKYRMPIYYQAFPEHYKTTSFETGCALLSAKMNDIITITRHCKYLKPYDIFTNSYLKELMRCMNDGYDPKKTLLNTKKKQYMYIAQKFPSLFKQIQQLRRYHNG